MTDAREKYLIITAPPDAEIVAKWDEFLQDAPFASHYVTPNYFIDPYIRGWRFVVLAMDNQGKVAAVLAGVQSGEKIVSGMFSRPQMIFRNGVDRHTAVDALLDGVLELGGERSFSEIHSWESVPEFAARGMQARPSNEDTSIVMLDLAAGADALFAGFSQTRRNEIRKAVKQGILEISELKTDDELAELYKIHCDWTRRKGFPADAFEDMQTATAQRENRRTFIARAEGKIIAGSYFRFCPGGVVEYAANNSLPEYQKLRPNDLIAWHAIQWACDEGFSHFSMGGANLFLRRFGGRVLTTYRYSRDRSRFRLNDLRENARDLGVGTYRRLPENVRSGMRKILAR